MFKKRAQGLSITTIIVAVIGLIILVVIVMMITGKIGTFREGVEGAADCANLCRVSGYDDPEEDIKLGIKNSKGEECICKPKPK